MKKIDTRGLSCPQPVMLVTKAIKTDNESLEILVDDETACENILRILENYKLKAEILKKGDYKVFVVGR
jgi:tRNA 2-thiouridine synthesizing protein A